MGTADITVLTPKVISKTIEEIRRGKRVWAQFYKTNRDLVRNGGNEIIFPKKNAGIVVTTNMSPGQTINTSYITYDATTIKVAKHGVGLAFYGEAIRQANRDVIADNIKEAGEAYADAMDTLALEAMFPSATVTATGASTVAASFPVVGIKSKSGGFSHIVNYSTSSSIVFTDAGTVVYWYVPSTAGARRVTSTSGSLSAKDVLEARADILGNYFTPTVLVIHPDRLTDLLYDPTVKFLEASAYRNAGPLFNGELGRIWDLRVVVTTKCPIYAAVLVDADELGYHVVRKELELQEDRVTGMKNDVLYFWGFAEESFGVVNQKAYGAVALQGTLTEANPTL